VLIPIDSAIPGLQHCVQVTARFCDWTVWGSFPPARPFYPSQRRASLLSLRTNLLMAEALHPIAHPKPKLSQLTTVRSLLRNSACLPAANIILDARPPLSLAPTILPQSHFQRDILPLPTYLFHLATLCRAGNKAIPPSTGLLAEAYAPLSSHTARPPEVAHPLSFWRRLGRCGALNIPLSPDTIADANGSDGRSWGEGVPWDRRKRVAKRLDATCRTQNDIESEVFSNRTSADATDPMC